MEHGEHGWRAPVGGVVAMEGATACFVAEFAWHGWLLNRLLTSKELAGECVVGEAEDDGVTFIVCRLGLERVDLLQQCFVGFAKLCVLLLQLSDLAFEELVVTGFFRVGSFRHACLML